MPSATLFLIALGLAMDAFAVSIASGYSAKRLKIKDTLKIAASFGSFQFFMPIIGWFAGTGIRTFISHIDHWIAFSLLTAIGGKMILGSKKIGSSERPRETMNARTLLALSIATSVDALAVGLSLSFLDISIVTPAATIGIVTFALSILGVYIGNRLGHFFEGKAELAGGLILIGIGVKILIDHL